MLGRKIHEENKGSYLETFNNTPKMSKCLKFEKWIRFAGGDTGKHGDIMNKELRRKV